VSQLHEDLPDLAEGRRRHYGDFYSASEGDPATDRPLLLVVGNCQAESLRLMLDGDDLATVRMPPVHELTADDLPHLHALLARCELLVTQPIKADYRGLPLGTDQLVDRLLPGARVALATPIRYAGLYPAHVLAHPPDLPDPDPPLAPYHDVRTLARAAAERDGRPAPAVPPLTEDVVRTVAAGSLAELRRRQVASGTVAVDDLVEAAGFAGMRAINHPGNPVLAGAAARLRDALGLEAREPTVDRPLLDAIHAPREPAVVAALDPSVEPREHWVIGGEPVPTAEVDAAHLDFYRRRPDVLAHVLTRTTDLRRGLGLPVVEP